MAAWVGRLLLATPSIGDGVFARSVVYLLAHGDDGAMGVIVNRPLPAEVDDVLPAWVETVSSPSLLFQGGPVATDSALAVGIGGETVALVDLDGPPPAPGALSALRVFAGYAGWSPGQLEEEVAEGSWLVVDADPREVFGGHPEALWGDLVRRQRGDLRLWASLPADPDLN